MLKGKDKMLKGNETNVKTKETLRRFAFQDGTVIEAVDYESALKKFNSNNK